MKCSGGGRSMQDCYQKAGEICPSGYNIVEQGNSFMIAGGMLAPKRSLVVECRS